MDFLALTTMRFFIHAMAIFVDTSAWFASFVPGDKFHIPARTWLERNQQRLVTTDYVLDELLTLLVARKEIKRCKFVRASFLKADVAWIEHITVEDFYETWEVHADYVDKRWSFTDCTSLVVMGRLGIRTAFSFDQHFRQFGTVVVVP